MERKWRANLHDDECLDDAAKLNEGCTKCLVGGSECETSAEELPTIIEAVPVNRLSIALVCTAVVAKLVW